jgi:hypothetical protein
MGLRSVNAVDVDEEIPDQIDSRNQVGYYNDPKTIETCAPVC